MTSPLGRDTLASGLDDLAEQSHYNHSTYFLSASKSHQLTWSNCLDSCTGAVQLQQVHARIRACHRRESYGDRLAVTKAILMQEFAIVIIATTVNLDHYLTHVICCRSESHAHDYPCLTFLR